MGVNAMKRNILCILLLFGIVVCMTGCNINNIFKTEEEKNDEKCQQIIMAIENHGGSLFVITENHGEISVDSRAIYTKMQNIPSKRYSRPVQEW